LLRAVESDMMFLPWVERDEITRKHLIPFLRGIREKVRVTGWGKMRRWYSALSAFRIRGLSVGTRDELMRAIEELKGILPKPPNTGKSRSSRIVMRRRKSEEETKADSI